MNIFTKHSPSAFTRHITQHFTPQNTKQCRLPLFLASMVLLFACEGTVKQTVVQNADVKTQNSIKAADYNIDIGLFYPREDLSKRRLMA